MGKLRGGLSTKIHAAVDDALGNPVRLLLTAGQTSEYMQAEALIEGFNAEYILADRGYDSNQFVSTIQALQAVMNRKNTLYKDIYKKTIIQADDFLPNPTEVRNRALNIDYSTPPSQVDSRRYGSIAEFTACDSVTVEEFISKFSEVVSSDISLKNIEFRYVYNLTKKRQVCHPDDSHLTCVVHLTLPKYGQGSTVFFRHKPTGDCWERSKRAHEYNYITERDWEESYRIESKFNRILVYPGKLFHAIGHPFFGTQVDNARLTLVAFIDLTNSRWIRKMLVSL